MLECVVWFIQKMTFLVTAHSFIMTAMLQNESSRPVFPTAIHINNCVACQILSLHSQIAEATAAVSDFMVVLSLERAGSLGKVKAWAQYAAIV